MSAQSEWTPLRVLMDGGGQAANLFMNAAAAWLLFAEVVDNRVEQGRRRKTRSVGHL